jgi:hypothetical protein
MMIVKSQIDHAQNATSVLAIVGANLPHKAVLFLAELTLRIQRIVPLANSIGQPTLRIIPLADTSAGRSLFLAFSSCYGPLFFSS